MTLYWAAEEWRAARKISGWMKDKYPTWTMTHSFYLLMGGFAFCSNKQGETEWKAIHPITFKERLEAVDIEFPTITEDEIKDKSKGDGLAKTITVSQMVWFSTQFIAWLAKGWATSELEVLTFATCVVMVIAYAFWWFKPLGVESQTPVCLVSASSSAGYQITSAAQDVERGTANPVTREESEHPEPVSMSQSTTQPSTPKSISVTSIPLPPSNDATGPRTGFNSRLFDKGTVISTALLSFFFLPFLFLLLPFYFLFMMACPSDPNDWEEAPPPAGYPDVEPGEDDGFGFVVSLDFAEITFFSSLWAFGALHFITWSFYMPTNTERWIWRSASITFCALPVILYLVFALDGLVIRIRKSRSSGTPQETTLSISAWIFVLCFLVHPTLRFIVVVDSLALLRALPPTAFLSLSWSSILPSL